MPVQPQNRGRQNALRPQIHPEPPAPSRNGPVPHGPHGQIHQRRQQQNGPNEAGASRFLLPLAFLPIRTGKRFLPPVRQVEAGFLHYGRNAPPGYGDAESFQWVLSFPDKDSEDHPAIKNLKTDPLYDGDEIQFHLERAIASLPDKQKLVFKMRYYDETSYREIAEILETSEGALKASYHHAIKKIEDYFKTKELI